MNNILFNKFGPRLTEIADLIAQFQESLYYIYDGKNVLGNFKQSTDVVLNCLIGHPEDNEETVFERLESDISSVKAYVDEWQENIDNDTYRRAIIIMMRLREEMESLLVAWNTQTDAEKREALSSMQKYANSKSQM